MSYYMISYYLMGYYLMSYCLTIYHIVELQVLDQGLGVDFTFAWDNNNNDKKDKNPHLNLLKGTVLGDKEQGEGVGDEG